VICEQCGRIGTTEVFAYDGELVSYRCRPDMVKWARGCGHEGSISPFDGRGKLPWKLEWVAKWITFPVTVEGAGKDHSTKGGSRDVSAACLRAIFGKEPPLNVPYEFFLVGGAKMSSSRGVGASARDIANLLPPEVLRFLMIRTKPNSPVNFDVKEEGIIKLFNEFDRYHGKVARDKTATADEACVYRLAATVDDGDYLPANFQLVTALVQMPHLDVAAQIEKRKGSALTETELHHLDQRIASARLWVEQYASEEEKTRLQPTLPERAHTLSETQRAFLHQLAAELPHTTWEDDALQAKIFEVARLTPIEQPLAFKAIYRVLLDREAGPKAGNLLAFLDPGMVVPRFRDLPLDQLAFLRESAISMEAFEEWHAQNAGKIAGIEWRTAMLGSVAASEATIILQDGKKQLKRIWWKASRWAGREWLAGSPAVAHCPQRECCLAAAELQRRGINGGGHHVLRASREGDGIVRGICRFDAQHAWPFIIAEVGERSRFRDPGIPDHSAHGSTFLNQNASPEARVFDFAPGDALEVNAVGLGSDADRSAGCSLRRRWSVSSM
jgi:lysyl-tRNA synthetase class 1